jgi:hypothetical protein
MTRVNVLSSALICLAAATIAAQEPAWNAAAIKRRVLILDEQKQTVGTFRCSCTTAPAAVRRQMRRPACCRTHPSGTGLAASNLRGRCYILTASSCIGCGSRKIMRRSEGSNDAVHGPLGTRLSRPIRVDGQVDRRVNPSPSIGAGAIRGNKRNNHGESA